MAGITGNGTGSVWLGNHIHDIQGSPEECHGIYIDGDGSYEIAYNLIEHIRSGNGFQIYVNGTNGSDVANNVNFHHNLIHDVSKHGINLADNARSGIVVFDNLVYDTQRAGIRFNTKTLSGAKIYNNTFYATNLSGNSNYGALTNDWTLPVGAANLYNNIFWPANNTAYIGGQVALDALAGTTSNNIFYGGSGATLGAGVISADPKFVNASGRDFHLAAGSPAIGAGTKGVTYLVTTDHELATRGPSSVDIGAFGR